MNGLLSYYGERRKLTQQCHLLETLPDSSFSYLVQLFRFLFVGLLEEGPYLVFEAQGGFKSLILLSQSPTLWDFGHVLHTTPGSTFIFSICCF